MLKGDFKSAVHQLFSERDGYNADIALTQIIAKFQPSIDEQLEVVFSHVKRIHLEGLSNYLKTLPLSVVIK